jgi:serine/threonine protein kinase
MQVDNLFLDKLLGKGSFADVYLTRIKDDNKLYATKVYNREQTEASSSLFNYLKAEINLLKGINHPNIVKLKDVTKTKKHFYLVLEYCNGGELKNALDKYKLKYNKAFSEEIVQYLMRQIVDAMNYLHSRNIMHRDIKLENILLNYDSEEDKNNLNIMKATVKIVDFGFAIYLKNALTDSVVGNPLNMDPLILKKLTSNGRIKKLGYDTKADVWSLGSICYEMLIGKPAFDAEDIDDLVDKIEKGDYRVPKNVSKEIVSFLNGMLQYDPNIRLSTAQLIKHVFLTENVNNFHKIDVNSDEIELNTKQKKNQTIWAIFNKADETKLVNISPSQIAHNPEWKGTENIPQQNSMNPTNNNFPINNPSVQSYNTYDNKNYPNMNNMNYFHQNNSQNYGPILPRRDENPIYINQKFDNETDYTDRGGIYDAK